MLPAICLDAARMVRIARVRVCPARDRGSVRQALAKSAGGPDGASALAFALALSRNLRRLISQEGAGHGRQNDDED